ncbi:hypothetical protein KAJ27_07535, partial [bacterium]|nr:hypothetical protein [bacterium]
IKFDRNLLENLEARNFLKKVSSSDDSFSVRYLARKLIESFEKMSKNPVFEEPVQKSDNSEIKMVSSNERLKKDNIERVNKIETLFVHGKTIDLDFDVKASQFGCVTDTRVFGFFIDIFLYLIVAIVCIKLIDMEDAYFKMTVMLSIGVLLKDVILGGRIGIGKKALAMDIINIKDHKTAGFFRLLMRNVTLLGPMSIIEGIFVILLSNDGRRLGDYLAGTKVITRVNQKLTVVGLIINYCCYFFFFMMISSSVFSGFGYLVNQKYMDKNMIKEEYITFYELSARMYPQGKWIYGKTGNENKRTIHYENVYKGITITFSRKHHPEICNANFSDTSMLKQLKEGTKIGLVSMGTLKGKLHGVVTTIDGYKAFHISFLLGASVHSPEMKLDHYFMLMNSGYIYTVSVTRENKSSFNSVSTDFIQEIKIQ